MTMLVFTSYEIFLTVFTESKYHALRKEKNYTKKCDVSSDTGENTNQEYNNKMLGLWRVIW